MIAEKVREQAADGETITNYRVLRKKSEASETRAIYRHADQSDLSQQLPKAHNIMDGKMVKEYIYAL